MYSKWFCWQKYVPRVLKWEKSRRKRVEKTRKDSKKSRKDSKRREKSRRKRIENRGSRFARALTSAGRTHSWQNRARASHRRNTPAWRWPYGCKIDPSSKQRTTPRFLVRNFSFLMHNASFVMQTSSSLLTYSAGTVRFSPGRRRSGPDETTQV